MVIVYMLSGVLGGTIAAGLGLAHSLPWYAIICLYSAGGTTFALTVVLLFGVVPPWAGDMRDRFARRQVSLFASSERGQLEHGQTSVGVQ